jgi:predicted metal-dependent phosphotriesterase family hydrolase
MKYINEKVEKVSHSELPKHIQDKFFKRKRTICNNPDKYYNVSGGCVSGNTIMFDRSGTTGYFSKSRAYYICEKIPKEAATSKISRGKALWLVKDTKSKCWRTC